MNRSRNILTLAGAAAFLVAMPCHADMLINPAYNVTLTNLGSVTLPSGVDGSGYTYRGLAFNGEDLLLADWNPAQATYPYGSGPESEVLWSVPVDRTRGEVTGLGDASNFANVTTSTNASYSIMVNGGLTFGPGGVLFYSTTQGTVGEYSSGTYSPVTLQTGGSNVSVTALGILPIGGSDQLVVVTSANNWYLASLTANNAFYNIDLGSEIASNIAATSFVYMPADPNAGFTNPGVLIGDSASQRLRYYSLGVDGSLSPRGNCPVTSDSQPCMVYSLTGASPGFGLARDPSSGNIFLTTSNNQVWMMQFGTPEPSTLGLTIVSVLLLCWRARSATAPRG